MKGACVLALCALFSAVQAYNDARCTSRGGRCQSTSTTCAGSFTSGLCGGPSSRRCCIPPAYNDARCTSRGGRCQSTSTTCAGSFTSGLCGGPSSRRCCIPPASGADAKCTERGGKCQVTSTVCRGGQYFSKLCSGASNRRCCVPLGSSGCPRASEQLACQLMSSSNVIAARSHPSGVRDDAYAYNNLRDMCRATKAARSSYRCDGGCNAPGGTTCLSYDLLNYLVHLKNGGSVRINELAGACHSCRSRHYSGLAVDLHKNGRQSEYISECSDHGGVPVNERNHVHCQFYDGQHPNWL